MTPVSETDRPILGMVVEKKNVNDRCREFRRTCTIILEMLKEQNVSNPDFVALTHWHWDKYFWIICITECINYFAR